MAETKKSPFDIARETLSKVFAPKTGTLATAGRTAYQKFASQPIPQPLQGVAKTVEGANRFINSFSQKANQLMTDPATFANITPLSMRAYAAPSFQGFGQELGNLTGIKQFGKVGETAGNVVRGALSVPISPFQSPKNLPIVGKYLGGEKLQQMERAYAPTSASQKLAQDLGQGAMGIALTAPLQGFNSLPKIASNLGQSAALGLGITTAGTLLGEKRLPTKEEVKNSLLGSVKNAWVLPITGKFSDVLLGGVAPKLVGKAVTEPFARGKVVEGAKRVFLRALSEVIPENTAYTFLDQLGDQEKDSFLADWAKNLPGAILGNLLSASIQTGGEIAFNKESRDALQKSFKKAIGPWMIKVTTNELDKNGRRISMPMWQYKLRNQPFGLSTKDINQLPVEEAAAIRAKVKQAQGLTPEVKPTVLYHATPNKFDKFDLDRMEGGAAWFTDNPAEIKNNTVGAVQGAGQRLNIMTRTESKGMKWATAEEANKYYTDQLIQMGYDGVKMESPNGKGNWYKVFDPNAKLIDPSGLTPEITTKGIARQTQSARNILGETGSLMPSTTESLQVPSTPIVNQKGKLNVGNLNLSDESRQLVRQSDTTPPTVIGNKSVVEAAKLTKGSKTALSDAQQQKILAQRLNSRQSVVTLTKEYEALKQAGASEKELIAKFREIADQSLIAKQEATLAGRQLQAQNILADELATPQQKVLALLENAGVSKEKYLKDAIGVDWNNGKQVVDFYRKYVPASLGEKLTEFRYTNMLSSPLTHITNIATNLLQSGVVTPVEKTLTGALDWVKSKTTGSERQYYVSDGINYVRGFYRALPEAWTKFKNSVSGKEITLQPDMQRIPVSTGKLYGSYTAPLKALEAADQFFVTLVKNGETASLQNRGLSATAIETAAEKAAQYRLFRQAFDPDGKLGQGHVLQLWDKYNSFVSQLRNKPGMNWIIPFLQTPTNVLKQGFEYSPFGVSTIPGSKKPLEQLSKTIIGTTVFAGAYGLLNSADFTWETPKGSKEREMFYAANMQPYSIKIGDKWVSYSKLGPLAYPIAMAAALRYAEKYNLPTEKENEISTALGSLLKFFSDQSYVKQLGDAIDAVQTGKGIGGGLKAEVTNSLSQLVPYKSFLGWLSRIIDPVSRNPQTIPQTIQSQLPFLSKGVEPYYNSITGEPSRRTDVGLNAISPIRISTENKQNEGLFNYTSNAKRAYSNIMRLPQDQRMDMFNKIKKFNPALAKEITNISNEINLGITAEDKKIQSMSVADGEKANAIYRKLNSLKTPEEKKSLWEKYTKSKIMSQEVARQVIKLLGQ